MLIKPPWTLRPRRGYWSPITSSLPLNTRVSAPRSHHWPPGASRKAGARSGRWRLQMPIGGLLIGMTDAQGHGFVIAATHDLERQRQSDRRGTIWQRQGTHLQQVAEARETRRHLVLVDVVEPDGGCLRRRR